RRPAGFRRGRRARIASRGSRAAVRQVPSRQYRGHRRRGRAGSRHLPRHRAPARRPHLGGDARRRRRRVPLYPAGRASAAGAAGRMTETRGTILVVEDEPEIRRFLRTSLAAEGYRVVEAGSGARGAIDAGSHKPDLAIVDLGLPDIDGVDVIRRIRAWSPMPILVLSARAQERSKVEALDAGADDYVTKPFGVGELLARVRVALRNATRPGSGKSALKLGKVSADLEKHVVKRDGLEVHLTALEFRLLACLAKHIGRLPAAGRRGLDFDSRAQLDGAVGGNVEEVGDAARVARHGGEQALAPERHVAAPRQ